MEDVHLGAKFWLSLAGISIAVCVGAGLAFLLIGAAWARWGALGALLFFGLLMLVPAYIYDRRNQRTYDDSTV